MKGSTVFIEYLPDLDAELFGDYLEHMEPNLPVIYDETGVTVKSDWADYIREKMVKAEEYFRRAAIPDAPDSQEDAETIDFLRSPTVTVDVDLLEDIPCEYRLLNMHTDKFVGGYNKHFVDTWREAWYFSSVNHGEGAHPDDESSLAFLWKWFRDECEMDWLNNEDINDYRVHVVIGKSGC